jgi:hypothetical protein
MLRAVVLLPIVLACAACGVEKGAALTEAPGTGKAPADPYAGATRLAVAGNDVYVVDAEGIHLDAVLLKAPSADTTILDVAVGTDRIVYSEAKASDAGTVQLMWTRLTGEGGSTISTPFMRPAGGLPLVTTGAIFYALHDKDILEWDAAANTVKTSVATKDLTGGLVAAGKLFTGDATGVYETDTSKSPLAQTSVATDAFGTVAVGVADVFYYAAKDKVFGYDAAAKKATTAFDAKGATAAVGDAKGVYYLASGKIYQHGSGAESVLAETECAAGRLLLTATKVLLDCPGHTHAIERP